MGNGVVHNHDNNYTFEKIERLCKIGHFFENHLLYKDYVEMAIENNSLDALEALIPAGNMKRLFPIHIASFFGRYEPLELFLSAGLNTKTLDNNQRTALHCCALSRNHSKEIALCITIIALNAPKLLQQYDKEGFLPLHLAIINLNIEAIKSLLDNGAKITQPDIQGKTAIELAKATNNRDVMQILKSYPNPNQSSSSNRESSEKNMKKQKDSDVSTDRIMQIWEKFFENAFMRMESAVDPPPSRPVRQYPCNCD